MLAAAAAMFRALTGMCCNQQTRASALGCSQQTSVAAGGFVAAAVLSAAADVVASLDVQWEVADQRYVASYLCLSTLAACFQVAEAVVFQHWLLSMICSGCYRSHYTHHHLLEEYQQ